MSYLRITGSALTAFFMMLSASPAVAKDTISLTVDASRSPQRLLRATLVIPVKPGPLTLYYPKWIPGAHGPFGPIESLVGLKMAANGQNIPWRRDLRDAFAFHLDVPIGTTKLVVEYDHIEPEGQESTDKLIDLEWNEEILYPADTPAHDLIYTARLILPRGWKMGTAVPVASTSGNETTFQPMPLDRLVDSPVVAGEFFRTIDITPAGEPIHHEMNIVADSQAALDMSTNIQTAFTNLVVESGKFFGARHYRDYHFLLTLSDHVMHFGLEHHDSNDSRLPERTLLSPDAGVLLGALVPHEFVHSWSGKFRRPAGMTTPDFETPMEDDLLWNYEGFTEFAGPLLATRSGFFTAGQYREYLANAAAMLGPGRPGRTWRPLLDTAVAVPGFGYGVRGWENWRRSIDYYDEGNLMWLEVATIIRRLTNGHQSIEDFAHAFYGGANAGPVVKAYTFEDVVHTLNDVAAYDWAAFFQRHVNSVAPAMPSQGILNSGWKVEFTEHPLDLAGRHGITGDVYTIGLLLRDDGTVDDAVVGGPAFDAGIATGMKVVGVNGRVYSKEILADAIKSSSHNSDITILAINDDYYKSFTIKYNGGLRYPHLIRDEATPDYLTQLSRSHSVGR